MRMSTFNEMYEPSGYKISRTGKPGDADQYTVYKDGKVFVQVADIQEAVAEVEYVFLSKDSTQVG